ncbi:MCM8-like protein [Mya arenaria]|uniref:MCM8-like protein n=1 Tax=Mya arenaria TaxID=6604 RepID=A0ABY7E1Y2_MYAAR|nr:MCM8-like protein [Mya arenaria]
MPLFKETFLASSSTADVLAIDAGVCWASWDSGSTEMPIWARRFSKSACLTKIQSVRDIYVIADDQQQKMDEFRGECTESLSYTADDMCSRSKIPKMGEDLDDACSPLRNKPIADETDTLEGLPFEKASCMPSLNYSRNDHVDPCCSVPLDEDDKRVAENIVRKLCKNGKLMEFQEGEDFIKVIVYEDSQEDENTESGDEAPSYTAASTSSSSHLLKLAEHADKENRSFLSETEASDTGRLFTPHPRSGYMFYSSDGSSQTVMGPPLVAQPIPSNSNTPITSRMMTPGSQGLLLNSSGEEVSPYDPLGVPSQQELHNRMRSLVNMPQFMVEDTGQVREQHNQKERRRRARIKEACNLLRQLVPGMSDKTDKATVFEFAARYVHFLKAHTGAQYDKASNSGGRGGGWRGNWRGQGWRGRGGFRGRGQYNNNRRGRGRGAGMMMPDSAQNPSRRPTLVQTRIDVASPYTGWKFYFPEEVYSDHSPNVKKIQTFEKYFLSWIKMFDLDNIEQMGNFTVDFKELCDDENITEGYPTFQTELREMPLKIVSCLGLAMHQHISQKRMREARAAAQESGVEITPDDYFVPVVHARIFNYGNPVPLKNLKANYYGKFVSVKGTVVRVSNIKPLCTVMAFQCNTCSETQTMNLPDGKYTVPTSCAGANCRARQFQPLRSSNLTETIDWQTIRLQEIMGDDQKEAGRIPRTVDCELTHDLVDSCVPGDIVTVSGVIKVNSVDEGRGGSGSGEGLAVDFTMKELYGIEMIQSEENLFRLLVGSVCPSIYGHELVKAGLVLGLFGGTHRFTNDKNRIPVRGDPHLLIVGDPGLGKSQMLQATANIAPRSVYVCGNTTTTSGLTVTLSKDGGSGDYALEAGALVLADQGSSSVSASPRLVSSVARTSILAAANPVGGHYNKAKTVAENLKMGSALLSRFDLVFILLDKPDEQMDSMMSEHVMSMHSRQHRAQSKAASSFADVSMNESVLLAESERPLNDRLKYVGYARKYVHPKIGPEAAKVIQTFYLELRRQHQTQDSTPITTRQLESLIRLTEARARLELREIASREDAEDVIEIMKYSMVDTYSDQFGGLDFLRSQHGSGMTEEIHSWVTADLGTDLQLHLYHPADATDCKVHSRIEVDTEMVFFFIFIPIYI